MDWASQSTRVLYHRMELRDPMGRADGVGERCEFALHLRWLGMGADGEATHCHVQTEAV